MTGVVAVDELASAYLAALRGEFRTGRGRGGRVDEPANWALSSVEHVVVVVGCHGGAGASTVALGLAEAAGDARVVECCTAAASGLAAASFAELGDTGDGWVRGSRGSVLIERQGARIGSAADCPLPSPGTTSLTIVDCGWELDLLASGDGWLGDVVRSERVVVVARTTVPGLRRLEGAVEVLGSDRVWAVVVEVERRWPRVVERSLGPRGRALRADGRLIGIAHDSALAINGVTPEPLPTSIITGCSALLNLLKGNVR